MSCNDIATITYPLKNGLVFMGNGVTLKGSLWPLIENSRFPRNIDIPWNIRAKLGVPRTIGGNPGILQEYQKG